MSFDRAEEIAPYRVLARVQAELRGGQSVLFSGNPLVRVPGHTWKPDLLVVHRGRAGIIDVDGASHYARLCADRSRDLSLRTPESPMWIDSAPRKPLTGWKRRFSSVASLGGSVAPGSLRSNGHRWPPRCVSGSRPGQASTLNQEDADMAETRTRAGQ